MSPGQLYLNKNEDFELNSLLPTARDTGLAASEFNAVAAMLTTIPDASVDLHYWGIGFHSKVFGGDLLATAVRIGADVMQMIAAYNRDQAGMAARTAGHQRRVSDWTLQANLAARELMQIGRQVIGSLIAEQVAKHEHELAKTQTDQSQAVLDYMQGMVAQGKFTNVDFYGWTADTLTNLYYQYYRFAVDQARKAEQTMKRELMRPELDAASFVQFNYWDSGHQGLLSGEALHLDIKRMELAYYDSNLRELELTRHVSLRQLDPTALLALKVTGGCSFTIPEWFFDRDCPGHHMRRIKTVALSLPSVVGPYTTVNCTLMLQSSTVRTSPLLSGGSYARQGSDDTRFVDYFGAVEFIVTSTATNDSGMFETNLRDERFLPFEGAGAANSTWQLQLPKDFPPFDYTTISDAILHLRYTARPAGDPLGSTAIKELHALISATDTSSLAIMFAIKNDFPTEWSAFVNSPSTSPTFSCRLQKSYFPYFVQGMKLSINALLLYSADSQPCEPAGGWLRSSVSVERFEWPGRLSRPILRCG